MHFHFTDPYRLRESSIHRLDPRVKVLATLFIVLTLGVMPVGSWLGYSALFALLLLLAGTSRLGFSYAMRRSVVALPFYLAAIGVVFTTPGPVLLELQGVGWTITGPGLVRFGSILLRTWLAVQSAILLTATTRFSDLLWALGRLRVPRTLIAIISFMYRYLFLLADEAVRMMRARTARSAQRSGTSSPPLLWRAGVTGSMVGSLFLRALERSERVYAAMLARGYDGRERSLVGHQLMRQDRMALGLLLVLLVTTLSVARLR